MRKNTKLEQYANSIGIQNYESQFQQIRLRVTTCIAESAEPWIMDQSVMSRFPYDQGQAKWLYRYSLLELGNIYFHGYGVMINLELAEKYWKQAVKTVWGEPLNQLVNLMQCYDRGDQ